MPYSFNRVLAYAAVAHALVGVGCAVWLLFDARPILGVHPALKPLKFAGSIAAFLATIALVLPMLELKAWQASAMAWVLTLTMIGEMGPIAWQALRGTTSHFNTRGSLDAALWQVMFISIIGATLAMMVLALVASLRPMTLHEAAGPSQRPLGAFMQTAIAAGLWMFQMAAVSGFMMGGRSSHTVGAPDGGPGLPLTNWSTSHGDLRVSHFVALHAVQTLPLLALLIGKLPLGNIAQWGLLSAGIAAHVLAAVWSLGQALAGRPIW